MDSALSPGGLPLPTVTPTFLTNPTNRAIKGVNRRTVMIVVLVIVAVFIACKLFSKGEGFEPIDESQSRQMRNLSPVDFATPTPILDNAPALATADYPTASPENSALSGAMELAYADSASPSNTQVQCNPVASVATDLLPRAETATDDFSTYAPKALQGQNFLDASRYIGVDTQGSSMKISSYDIRNIIPNPKVYVGPWNQSTVTSDPYRRNLD